MDGGGWDGLYGNPPPDYSLAGLAIGCLVIGVIPAMIARSKGHNWVHWYIYGVLLGIIALVHSLLLKPNAQFLEHQALATGDSRKCPYCAEIIKREAVVCKHCHRDLPPPPAGPHMSNRTAPKDLLPFPDAPTNPRIVG